MSFFHQSKSDRTSVVRLRYVVPGLRALFVARPTSLQAFTLIEIMVAITISTVIILCAVSCFRMISKAIATATAMSNVNSLLRTGLQLAWQDTDYWHSSADPNLPYSKGWSRLPTGPGTNLAEQQNIWRRPFQPIRFVPRTDTSIADPNSTASDPTKNYSLFNATAPTLSHSSDEMSTDYYNDPYNRADYLPNPNALLAHDPRSIGRAIPRSMQQPEIEGIGYNGDPVCLEMDNYQKGLPQFSVGDYTLTEATDMRDPPNIVNPKYPVNPSPTSTVIIPLDTTYCSPSPSASSIETYINHVQTDHVEENIPLDMGVNSYQPLLWTGLFHRLSYISFEYMSPGTTMLYCDQTGRTPDVDAIPLPPFMYNTSSNFYSANVAFMWDRDYAWKAGNCDMATRLGMNFVPSDNNGGHSARAVEAIPFRSVWPLISGLTTQDFDAGAQSFPLVDIVGSQATEAQAAQMTYQTEQEFTVGDQTRLDEIDTSQTLWLPYNITDLDRKEPSSGTDLAPTSTTKNQLAQLDYVSKPTQAPVMSTTIMRYGKVGGCQEMCVVRVSVDDPVSGRKIDLTCIPYGTTFRGARQHMRLYSPALSTTTSSSPGMRFAPPPQAANPANDPAGDYYDNGAGPYYVVQP
jgi:prepilin-type N-terminal cleavage/methylation domain-containing protein